MNPFAVVFAVVLILIPFLLFFIAITSDMTQIFFQLDGNSFMSVYNIVNFAIWVIVVMTIAFVAVLIIFRRRT